MAQTSSAPRSVRVGRQAIERFREIERAGALPRLCAVDRQTGELLDAEARGLFAALPAITPATTADELVQHGLVPALPRQLQRAYERPKYFKGREVFVRATVRFDNPGRRSAGYFHPEGESAFTHRGVLVGQRGDDFYVELEGAPTPLRFRKADILAWNESWSVGATGGTLCGIQIDYNDPLWKAQVCAGYLSLGDTLSSLDFSAADDEVLARQRQLVYQLAARVRMEYAGRGEGYSGGRPASLVSGGQAGCFAQAAIAAGYLQAFARVLAFELQTAVGRTLRLKVPHGFVIVTLRPSMRRFVCDPAWSEPLTDSRVAFYDSGWGHDRRLIDFEGSQETSVRASDIDLPQLEQP